jgi:tetratricopeptide (TPR) repeat protein
MDKRSAARRGGSAKGTSGQRARPLGLAALLVGAVVLVYLPALGDGFVWDDDFHVTANACLRDWAGLVRIWTEPGATPQYYPLTHTTFWLEYHAWGLWAAGYHGVSVLLHAANVLLVWRILRRLAAPGAYWVAMLFAVHPVLVESVAWITERKNVLSAALYLSALLIYMKFSPLDSTDVPPQQPRWRWYALATLCFVGALLSKTVTCTLPAVVLLACYWKRGRIPLRHFLAMVPWFVLGAGLGLLTVRLERHHVGAEGVDWSFSAIDRALIAGRAWWFYLEKLAWPFNLAFIYPRWQIDSGVWWQYFFPLSALAVLGLLWGWRGRLGRGPLCALLFFSGTLVPALGFFDVYPMRYSFVADHFQYLACLGPLALAVAAARAGLTRVHPVFKIIAARVMTAFVLVGLGLLSCNQAYAYHDPLSLWSATLRNHPGCWMAYQNLGMMYQKAGDTAKALAALRTAIEIHPAGIDPRLDAATLLVLLNRPQEALAQYREVLRREPDSAAAHANMANLLTDLGDYRAAAAHYEAALSLAPDSVMAHYNYGNMLSKHQQLAQAETQFKAAIGLEPSHSESHNGLGTLYAERGEPDRAIEEFRRAVEFGPANVTARKNLAIVLARQRRLSEAIGQLREALKLRPGDAELERGLRSLKAEAAAATVPPG